MTLVSIDRSGCCFDIRFLLDIVKNSYKLILYVYFIIIKDYFKAFVEHLYKTVSLDFLLPI